MNQYTYDISIKSKYRYIRGNQYFYPWYDKAIKSSCHKIYCFAALGLMVDHCFLTAASIIFCGVGLFEALLHIKKKKIRELGHQTTKI